VLASDLLEPAERDEILSAALVEVARLPATTWGALHRAVPWQASPRALPALDAGVSGDFDCVLATSSFPGRTHLCLRGPVARFVWDVRHRERSRWSAPFGASGQPDSPHFLDQLSPWLRGEVLPVVTDVSFLPEEPLHMSDVHSRPRLFEHDRPGLGRVWFSPVNPAADIDLIDAWVKEERAQFWGMRDHTKEYVQEIYEYLDSLPTHHAYLCFLDDEPIALLQTYQPSADPVGQFYPVADGDFGVHALLGPTSSAKIPGFTAYLATAFRDFVFSDPSVQRVVIEPDIRNAKALARVEQLGFVLGPQIELPEKSAQLAFLHRDAAKPLPLSAFAS
jgi:penicillin G amidase